MIHVQKQKQPMAALQLLYHAPKAEGCRGTILGARAVIPAPAEKELESLVLLSGWSCVLMLFPAIWPLYSLREVPTVIFGHSWITWNHITWNPSQLMVRSCLIYQIQPIIYNSKFWLRHEEICWFSSWHCSLLLKKPFLWEGLWVFFLRELRECETLFSPQANSTLLIFRWK